MKKLFSFAFFILCCLPAQSQILELLCITSSTPGSANFDQVLKLNLSGQKVLYEKKWYTKQLETESSPLSDNRTFTIKNSVFTWTESEIEWGSDLNYSNKPDEVSRLRMRLSRVTGRVTGYYRSGSNLESYNGECKKLEGKKF